MGGYSANVSSGKEAIKSSGKLANISKHVMREYTSKKHGYDGSLNVILIGGGNIHQDVTDAYEKLFGEAVREYDAKQKRADRKIGDYFRHLSEATYSHQKQDLAVSIILQCADMEFWQGKSYEEKRKFDYIARDQLKHIEEVLPDFKITSATIHYDEASPHVHVVGVPIRRDCKNGLSVQVSKRTVFTRDVMRNILQGSLRDRAERGMKINYKDFDGFDRKITNYEKRKNHELYNPENRHETVPEFKARKILEAVKRGEKKPRTFIRNRTEDKNVRRAFNKLRENEDDTVLKAKMRYNNKRKDE
jgi:hypothetical protein